MNDNAEPAHSPDRRTLAKALQEQALQEADPLRASMSLIQADLIAFTHHVGQKIEAGLNGTTPMRDGNVMQNLGVFLKLHREVMHHDRLRRQRDPHDRDQGPAS
jgi:hypothetical protein